MIIRQKYLLTLLVKLENTIKAFKLECSRTEQSKCSLIKQGPSDDVIIIYLTYY